MRIGVMIMAMGALAACTEMAQTSQKAAHDARKRVYDTATKVQDWTRYAPPSNVPQAAQTGYCYQTVSDVVCYDAPQQHLTSKLVGYQENGLFQPARPAEISVVPVAPAAQSTPFYVKQAPYVQANGQMVSSSKAMPVGLPTPPAPPSHEEMGAESPKSLMPRY